jgi:hypothetical protein
MTLMFSDALQFNGDLNGWVVSNVITMEGMFSDANTFNRDLNDWDVTSVKNMEFMFGGETHFNGNISSWDVSGVTSMFGMFSGNEGFNQNIGSWDVQSVDNISYMFDGATAFDQNLATWDLSNVLTAENMFTVSGISIANYDDTLIGWAIDTSPGIVGVDDIPSNVRLDATSEYCASEAARDLLINSYDWTINDNGLDPNCDVIEVSPKVFLQGASLNPNTGEDQLMRDNLRVNDLIPSISPYGDAAIVEASVLTGVGTEAIVDWVWVELRHKDDNSSVVDSQSALLQRNGDVVAIDGVSPLSFYQVSDAYYVSVSHRNHVGIISSSAIAIGNTATSVDLSSDPLAVEGGANAVVALANGRYGMYTGDFNSDGQVQNSDANAAVQLIGSSDYSSADMDVNSQVQNSDINSVLIPNIGTGQQFSRTSTAPLADQFTPEIAFTFANAEITTDGTDTYYEADILIESTEDFYVGSGQIYIEYNTAAFGENISNTGVLDYRRPEGSILGQTFFNGALDAYELFVKNDNTSSRVSLSFQQQASHSIFTNSGGIVTSSTPEVLMHIKLKYVDVSQDADICFFYNDDLFQDQFYTTEDIRLFNDSYDCSAADASILGINDFDLDTIVLYPNPTSTSFKIKGLNASSTVKVYDINGRLIRAENYVADQSIDMSRYEDGVYIVELSSETAKVIKRLIKKAN